MAVNGAALEGVVGALEIAMIEKGTSAAVQRTGIQSGDKAAVAGFEIVTIGKSQLSLADSFHATRAVF